MAIHVFEFPETDKHLREIQAATLENECYQGVAGTFSAGARVTDPIDEIVAGLLPCQGLLDCPGERLGTHLRRCPGNFRPAVAAKMRERDEKAERRVGELEALAKKAMRELDAIRAEDWVYTWEDLEPIDDLIAAALEEKEPRDE